MLHYRHRLRPYLDELTQSQLQVVSAVFRCSGQELKREQLTTNIMQAVHATTTPLMSLPLNIVPPALETEKDLAVLLGDWLGD